MVCPGCSYSVLEPQTIVSLNGPEGLGFRGSLDGFGVGFYWFKMYEITVSAVLRLSSYPVSVVPG